MSVIDIILGGLLLYGLIKGLWRGLFVELASLVSLIAGIFIALKFSGFLADVLSKYVEWEPRYISITAFLVTFIGVVVGIILLAKFFTKLADFASLGLLNRILGGVFGFLKMVLILSVSLNFFLKLNSNNLLAKEETLEESIFFYPMLEISNTIFPILEEWFTDFKEQQLPEEKPEVFSDEQTI